MEKIVGADPKTDIAVIKINAGNCRQPQAADSDKLSQVSWEFCPCYRQSVRLSFTVTMGNNKRNGKSNCGNHGTMKILIQTDAAINPQSEVFL